MDVFEYSCPLDGIVAAIERCYIPRARPPVRCPICDGELRVDVVHHDTTLAGR